jgi:sulfate permease, SulP family
VSAGVIVVVLAARWVDRRIPGLLIAVIAVIAAIIVSRAAGLAGHGVAVLGPVPCGLPHLALPALGRHDAAALTGTAACADVPAVGWGAPPRQLIRAGYSGCLVMACTEPDLGWPAGVTVSCVRLW